MAATVAEIGRLAGVSSATVSRAINNSGSVSPKAREAILRVMRDIGYTPRQSSETRKPSDKGGKTKLVEIVFHRHSPVEALAVQDGNLDVGPLDSLPSNALDNDTYRLGMSFHRRVIEAVVAELARWDYRSVLRFASDLTDGKFIDEMNRPDRQGVLLAGEYAPNLKEFCDRCEHPLVLVDLLTAASRDVITIDNLQGIAQAFDHLYELGHRRIGFVGVNDAVVANRERFQAFRMKLAEHDLPSPPGHVFQGHDHIQEVSEGVVPMLNASSAPTAVICANDCYALGVIRAAANLGISIPRQLSVVGFDDIEVAAMVTPPLTTVHVPKALMGQQAARQLMSAIEFPPSAPGGACETRVRTHLVVRGSTAPCESADRPRARKGS